MTINNLTMGDRVTNRKLGIPILGYIDGIIPGHLYCGKVTWESEYSDWKEKYVLYIKLDVQSDGNDYLIFPEDDIIKLDEIGVD